MFFTQELLSRRDSGFGLLWLAATLGAKSSFKKLPKRDVMGADIAQLCDLIAEPGEPLALRLSSTLMVGVARVYKIKHEIFLGDVTACFSSLKKAVQDIHTMSAAAASLQMGQPTVRVDAVTLTADPALALGINFGDFHWDDNANGEDGSDDEYGRPKKNRRKQGKQPPGSVENARTNLHMLNENLEQVLSGSFDVSFLGSASGMDPSSSQIDGAFGFDGFDDNPFIVDDGLDLGGDIGDELAKELGEGWGGTPAKPRHDTRMDIDVPFHIGSDLMGLGFDQGLGFTFAGVGDPSLPSSAMKDQGSVLSRVRKRPMEDIDQDLTTPTLLARSPSAPISPPPVPLMDAAEGEQVNGHDNPIPRKAKRVRLLLDARTELTDDELKTAREQYVEGQEALRREIERKKLEKETGKLIDEMLWGVPRGLRAPILVDYWLENFRVQVEARSGALYLETKGAPPAKRRRVDDDDHNNGAPKSKDAEWEIPADFHMDAVDLLDEDRAFPDPYDGGSHRPSSEEPGQARRVSRPPSPLDRYLGFDLNRSLEDEDLFITSQKSSLFPWDNAGGPSSSVDRGGFDPVIPGSDRVSVGKADVRIKATSAGRNSSIGPSFLGSNLGAVGFSPAPTDIGRLGSQDHFEFDVSGEGPSLADSQLSDANLVTLERNSYNFLEYAKMQSQTLPRASTGLTFDDVVPKDTSTPHVASAAFYHCLVLATKNLIRVAQPEAYGTLKIQIV